MTYAVYEYDNVDEALSLPVEPPFRRTVGVALGSPHVVDNKTRAVRVVAVTAAHVRLALGASGTVASTQDERLGAGEARTFAVLRRRQGDGLPVVVQTVAAVS